MPNPPAPPSALREIILAYKRALLPDEVANLFNLTPPTVYRLAKQQVIPCFHIGTSVRFDPRRLADWYDRQ